MQYIIICYCVSVLKENKIFYSILPGENGWIHWAAIVVDDGEGGTRILGHGNAIPVVVIRY